MKTVAIIAPQFIPCSYPNVHRVRFFTNHLKEFGWLPIVLTVDPKYTEEPADPEFEQMVPKDFEIIRVKAFSPRWTRKFGVGDLGIRCFPFMLKALAKLCSQTRIDLVFITSPPWHTLLLGSRIKKKFGIPFVLDYQDPWVSSAGQGSPFWKKSFWFRQMAIWFEPYALNNVDHVVSVSAGTNDLIKARYPSLDDSLFSAVPLGGEPSDFDYLRQNPRVNPFWDENDGKFHISFVGVVPPKTYETLRAFLFSLIHIREKEPDIYKRIRVHFFGTTYAPAPKDYIVMPFVTEMGLNGIVTEHPKRIPYLDAINILCQSDAILTIGTSERHYTASKIFPCILAKRPLLAVYHEASSVVDILKKIGTSHIVTYSDTTPVSTKVNEIYEKLLSLVKSQYNSNLSLDMKTFGEFSARKMTSELVNVFEKILSLKGL